MGKDKLGICPFCKKNLNEWEDIDFNEEMGKWILFHMCNNAHHSCITIVDVTKEKVIERWNASQNRKDD